MLLSSEMSRANATTPVAKKKGAYHHGDLERALVAAAADLAQHRGPEGVTLREVAAKAGVTHGAAYRHFEDKTALLAAVAEDGFRALAAHLARAASSDPRGPRGRLSGMGKAYVEFALERPGHYRVMFGPRVNEDGRFPSLEAAIEAAFGFLLAEIEHGQAEGVFRKSPARDLAVTVWIAAHGFVELVSRRRLKVKSPKIAVEYFERLFAPFIAGISRERSE
jgi:AcrR family transcriptional regulator